jgi:hypothetical protein
MSFFFLFESLLYLEKLKNHEEPLLLLLGVNLWHTQCVLSFYAPVSEAH